MSVAPLRITTTCLLLFACCCSGPAWGQALAGDPPSRGRQIAQDLLNQLGGSSSTTATRAAADALQTTGGVDLSNVAGLDRAQSFLDQHLPGRLDLNRRDLGLGVAGVNVPPSNTRTDLHRSAANEAARAFREGEYVRAVRWLVAVTSDLPQDGELRQFESLAWLAVGQVDKSEAALVLALQYSRPWDLARLQQFFGQPEVHQALLDQMGSQAEQRASTASFWLLVAYHERMLGNDAQCNSALARVRELDVAKEIPAKVLNQLQPAAPAKSSVLD